MEKLFFYKRIGKYEDYNDEIKEQQIFGPRLKYGENNDVAVCKSLNKEEAFEIFSKYFKNVTIDDIFSIDELLWIDGGKISLLTPY
jgi:hypothetical protein